MATRNEYTRLCGALTMSLFYVSLKAIQSTLLSCQASVGEPLIVSEEPAKQRILSAMADEYSRKILTATIESPMSALELSKKYEIPITTVYRRIEELVEAGLIAAVKSGRTTDGKWYDLYRSLLRRIDVSFEKGDVRIDVSVNEHVADKFTRMWASIPTV